MYWWMIGRCLYECLVNHRFQVRCLGQRLLDARPFRSFCFIILVFSHQLAAEFTTWYCFKQSVEICRLTVIIHFLAETLKRVSRHIIWLLTANRIRFIFDNQFVQTTSPNVRERKNNFRRDGRVSKTNRLDNTVQCLQLLFIKQ